MSDQFARYFIDWLNDQALHRRNDLVSATTIERLALLWPDHISAAKPLYDNEWKFAICYMPDNGDVEYQGFRALMKHLHTATIGVADPQKTLLAPNYVQTLTDTFSSSR